ncbi:hypothetical protein FNH22_16625 [Fulvivirga sp. M361]|uniref:sensor histidine kinase n=1 Tax=Fulvivirga sp. M361 TaxID=2594266 RepID=UPI001179F446|nr:histidine kinase [Fulvivirga sp. M361]TRX56263.1 hypothetical protein FNH22_16625 [Fulvivirga sp. M361]
MTVLRTFIKSRDYQFVQTLCWASIILVTIGYYFIAHDGYSYNQLIYDPVAYYIVLWSLSWSIPYLFISSIHSSLRYSITFHSLMALLFGMLHFLLTGTIILLLERLLNLPEHFTFHSLIVHWQTEWHLIVHGSIWYTVYLILLYALYFYKLYDAEVRKNNELTQSLSSAHVQTLSTQLNPHFLFNALNTVSMMIRKEQGTKAVDMLASLGEMLRAVLSKNQELLITISDEVTLLKKYISIESIRFGDRVETELDINKEILKYKVPRLLLQPVVENAYKHGMRTNEIKAKVKITGKKDDQKIMFRVFNNGSYDFGWSPDQAEGIGLSNTVNRLRELYGTAFTFQIREKNDGVSVDISLPAEL